MTDQRAPRGEPRIGKALASLGVVALATSIILGFTNIGGTGFHDVLQFGGIGLLLGGYVVWKVIKV